MIQHLRPSTWLLTSLWLRGKVNHPKLRSSFGAGRRMCGVHATLRDQPDRLVHFSCRAFRFCVVDTVDTVHLVIRLYKLKNNKKQVCEGFDIESWYVVIQHNQCMTHYRFTFSTPTIWPWWLCKNFTSVIQQCMGAALGRLPLSTLDFLPAPVRAILRVVSVSSNLAAFPRAMMRAALLIWSGWLGATKVTSLWMQLKSDCRKRHFQPLGIIAKQQDFLKVWCAQD